MGKRHPFHCPSETWVIQQPGSLKTKRISDAMDPFQASRPAHSHLSSLSIPNGSAQTPWTPTATSSPVAAPHRLSEIWAIWQPGTLQIKHVSECHGPLPSLSLDLLTHICPPFPYPMAVEKHHEHQRPPHLPPQHPIVCMKSGRSGLAAGLTPNQTHF